MNLQNLPRAARGGVDLRSMLATKPGRVFINADYPQIEARGLLWQVGDVDQLELIQSGVDVYEAHARSTMGYEDPRPLAEVDPEMRRYAKARVLGCGYGCGWMTFQTVARVMAGLELSPKESRRTVDLFRASNPKIVDFWRECQTFLEASRGEDLTIELPSGREMVYRNVTFEQSREGGRRGSWKATTILGQPPKYVYGGKIVENLIQAACRDLLGFHWLMLEDNGFPVVLTVHDEFLIEVEERRAESALKEIEQILTVVPDWFRGLPLVGEARILTRYTK